MLNELGIIVPSVALSQNVYGRRPCDSQVNRLQNQTIEQEKGSTIAAG